MASTKRTMSLPALALLALVCHAAIGVNSDHGTAKAYAIKVNANGDDTASIPDFDGDGTIGFGDFLIFAEHFGTRQADVGYDAQFDLNDDAEIGFADFLIFAENFGKEVAAPGAGGANKMYWTDWGTDKIQRSNLDGSDVEDLVTSGLVDPPDIALDVAGGKMYWTDYDLLGGRHKIQRSNLDGSDVEDLVTSGLVGPNGIALDVAGGKMYWTEWFIGTDKDPAVQPRRQQRGRPRHLRVEGPRRHRAGRGRRKDVLDGIRARTKSSGPTSTAATWKTSSPQG